jgi:hypothetical protein
MGKLDQHPGAVARAGVGPRRAAVLEVVQRGQREVDDVVAGLSVKARDERDAAGIVLEGRVVETSRSACAPRPVAKARQAHLPKFTAVGDLSGG